MAYEPLHHKYRPQTFGDLVGQETIALTLSNALKQARIAPAYLFTGPRGTGKTSSARILAKSLNCLASDRPTPHPCGKCEVCLAIAKGSALDVMEIDAASNTGVDNIREIIERSRFAPVQCRYKIYAIDECHMLSTAAFNALLKTLEEPPPQVVFILATTDPQRVLSTIISRCQRFDYRRIPLAEMTSHLRYIADAEEIAIANDALTLVAQISNGGLRDAESLLDQLSLLPETITVEKVWDLVGAVPEQDLLKLLQAINSNDSIAVLQQCRSLLDRGREPLVVLQNLASFYLNLLIAKTAPQHSELTAVTETCWQQLCESGKSWQTSLILRGQQHLKEAETQLKRTTQPRLWLEITLLGLLPEARKAERGGLGGFPHEPSLQEAVAGVHADKSFVPVEAQGQSPRSSSSDDWQSSALREQEVHSAISTNPQTVVPTSPQQIVTPLPTVVITPPATPQSTPPQNTPPQNTQAAPAIPVETNHLSTASPTQQPNSAPPAVQSPPPQVEQNFDRQQTITQPPVNVAPEPVAPGTDQDPAANQQIWSQVVSCLQPPTTQALLKQQCHLVSFDGISAIVGVSSAKLQKMTQQKIPNIEAAFAQVCQRKVRVQLEVASAKKKPNNNSHHDIASISQSPALGAFPETPLPITTPQQPPDPPPPPVNSHTQTAQPREKDVAIQTNNAPRQAQAAAVKSSIHESTEQTQGVNRQSAFVINPSSIRSDRSLDNNVSDRSSTLDRDYADSDLQQAIESLTQSFEGEVVQLDNDPDNLDDDFEEEEEAEVLPEWELITPSDRPDVENYDDDW